MPRPKDEAYIIDLCDDVLGLRASRGHRFDFLRGDPGTNGARAYLPVDAFYSELALVVEYHERQHSEPVSLFDRRSTVSGVTRAEQRKLYDERRRQVLPASGITLIEFRYSEFPHTSGKRLRRMASDIEVVRSKLRAFVAAP